MWPFKKVTEEEVVDAHKDMQDAWDARKLAEQRQSVATAGGSSEVIAADVEFWQKDKAADLAEKRYYKLRRRFKRSFVGWTLD